MPYRTFLNFFAHALFEEQNIANIFLIYKEIWKGFCAKSTSRNSFLMHLEMWE